MWVNKEHLEPDMKQLTGSKLRKEYIKALYCHPTHLTYMQDRKHQLELDIEQWIGSKLGKVYIKAVYCHPAYFTYTQITSSEMPG